MKDSSYLLYSTYFNKNWESFFFNNYKFEGLVFIIVRQLYVYKTSDDCAASPAWAMQIFIKVYLESTPS